MSSALPATNDKEEPRDAPRRPTNARPLRLVAIALIVSLVLGAGPGARHARAASLLLRFSAGTPGLSHEVDEDAFILQAPTGPTRARLYLPSGVVRAPGVVLIPGVHHLGVDEPRLQRFARAIASAGVAVMTPEIRELTEYRIEPASIGTIGAAAHDLARRLGRERVGVMGMSFAGGLSLLAAADPDPKSAIGFVVAVGAHDDLPRVARFFATDEIAEPNGAVVHMKAHEYGMLVLVHAHVEDFFPKEDESVARETLKLWLFEERAAAREAEKGLSAKGREEMDRLLGGRDARAAEEVLASVKLHEASMADVSPHGHLGSIHVPVYLLHGAGDSVIPPAETHWLASEVPQAWLRSALVSPAIQHVELEGEPSIEERFALVHFMAGVLAECGDETKVE